MKDVKTLKSRVIPYMKISEMISNDRNPRTISEEDVEVLKISILESPSFMELRPIILDKFGIIQGGNQRFKACEELGLTEVPFDVYTEERYKKDLEARKKLAEKKGSEFIKPSYKKMCKEFVIKDNLNAGKFDNEMIIEDWELDDVRSWGMDIYKPEEVNLDEFFEEDNSEPKELKNKIVLEYSEQDFEIINNKLNSMDGSKENIIWKLLDL